MDSTNGSDDAAPAAGAAGHAGDGAAGADPRLDQETLTPVVRAALGDRRAEVGEWSLAAVHGGLDPASAVYRVRGVARVGTGMAPWLVILKVNRALPDREAPQSTYYWRREAQAYASGVLDRLADGLVAPRCYGVHDRDRAVWLWLEDVSGTPGPHWTATQALAAARRFGAFNGAYLGGRPLPDAPWLGRALRRAQAFEAAPGVARLAALRGHPLVRAGWPNGLDEAVLRFWEEDCPRFLDALGRLPQTLQHGDPAAPNLFARPVAGGRDEETVVIDWAWVGVTAVGEDLACLMNYLPGRAADGDRDAFAQRLVGAYEAGLRDGGWRGDPRLVRLGYALSTALRYLLHPGYFWCLDEAQHPRLERARGMPVEQLLRRLSDTMRRAVPVAEEARALLRVF